MTRSERKPHNNDALESIPRASVKLGSQPGTLLAALPAMMGFTPHDSVIVIGLYRNPTYRPDSAGLPTDQRPSRYRVGPVVRTDLDFEAIGEAIDTLTQALEQFDDPSAIAVCLHGEQTCAEDYLDGTRYMLEIKGIDVLDSIYLPQIASGQTWVNVYTGERGVVGDIVDNPMRSHTAIRQARVFPTREELEHWLDIDSTAKPVYPRRFADAHRDPGEAVALLKDLSVIVDAVESVRTGQVTVEESCSRRRVIVAVSAVARDTALLSMLSTLAVGSNAPIMREILAEAARRTRRDLRLRLMAVLAGVLIANGEGMPAYHTLNRVLDGLRPSGSTSDLTEGTSKIAATLRTALMEGRAESITEMVALHGLMVLTNWELPVDEGDTGTCSAELDQLQQEWSSYFFPLLERCNSTIDWSAMTDGRSEPDLPGRW